MLQIFFHCPNFFGCGKLEFSLFCCVLCRNNCNNWKCILATFINVIKINKIIDEKTGISINELNDFTGIYRYEEDHNYLNVFKENDYIQEIALVDSNLIEDKYLKVLKILESNLEYTKILINLSKSYSNELLNKTILIKNNK